MPVVTPSRASTEIVYAVRSRSLLCGVISGISSRSSISPGIGTQITPLEWRIVNAISSGVALLAAKMMSPSFSRSSSSTTTTALPAAMSAIASSTRSRRIVALQIWARSCGLTIFSTYFAITSTSRLTTSPGCLLPSVVRARVSGIRLTVNAPAPTSTTVSEMPSTVIDPLATRYRARSAGSAISTTSQCSLGVRRTTLPVPSTWPCTMWPPSRVAGVTARSRLTRVPGQGAERGLRQRLVHHVGGEGLTLLGRHGEAAAVDRDRVAQRGVAGDEGAADREPDRVTLVLQRLDGAELLDDAGEHLSLLSGAGSRGRHGQPHVGLAPVPTVATSRMRAASRRRWW